MRAGARRAAERDVIEYVPLHGAQRAVYRHHTKERPAKYVQYRLGRRSGKTTLLEQIGVKRAATGKKVGWFVPEHKLWTPSYKRMLRQLRPLVSAANKTEALIETETGGCLEFWTLENEDAGRSRNYDLVIGDEISLKKKGMREVWEQAIKPTLLDRNGDALFAGTPKGIDPDNFYYAISQDARAQWVMDDAGELVPSPTHVPPAKPEFGFVEYHLPTWKNPHLNAEAVARLREENAPLVYLQEYCADFVDWRGEAFFRLPSMLVTENGVEVPISMPERCDYVFATLDTAVKTGTKNDGSGVVYWARTKLGGAAPLAILDYDARQIEGAMLETWLPSVFDHLEMLARRCGARMGSAGVWIEDKASGSILIQQGRRRGWKVHAIDNDLTALGKEERALSVSGYVFRGEVKLTREAHDKTIIYKQQSRNHLISQVCGFRMGEKDPLAEDDIFDAFVYGVSIALGNGAGY
jgi:hypothetical protein